MSTCAFIIIISLRELNMSAHSVIIRLKYIRTGNMVSLDEFVSDSEGENVIKFRMKFSIAYSFRRCGVRRL
jgi:hypothetical protein